MDLKYKTFKGN